MHGRDAGILEFGFQAEIEIWRVDADEQIRPPRQQAVAQGDLDAFDFAIVARNFEQAVDR